MSLLDRFKKTEKKTEKKTAKKKPAVSGVKQESKPQPMKKIAKKEFSDAYRILRRPIVTEKSVRLGDKENQYVFEVFGRVNKKEIKEAVQDSYGVRVERVNIINVPGKIRRRGRQEGFRSGYKKATVFLAEGEKIEIISR
jgi:large subunit ribosomal protein L23